MALILTPDEWDSQPSYVVGVDRANPLGAKARFAIIGGPAPVELCRGIPMGGGQGAVEVTAGGLAYVLPTTASTWVGPASDLDTFIGGSLTVCWYGILGSNSTGVLFNSVGGYGWHFYTSAYAPGVLQLVFGGQWSGAGAFAQRPTLVDGVPHTVCVRYNDLAATAEFFLDGVSLGTPLAFTKDPGATSGQTFSMYDLSSGARPHKMLTVQAFATALQKEEIRAFSANPWGIFEQDDELLWVPGATAPATFNPAWARNSNSILTGPIQ